MLHALRRRCRRRCVRRRWRRRVRRRRCRRRHGRLRGRVGRGGRRSRLRRRRWEPDRSVRERRPRRDVEVQVVLRVHRHVVQPDLEVQVLSRREARRTRHPDHDRVVHRLPVRCQDLAEVPVERREAVPAVDDHVVSIDTAVARVCHGPLARRRDRRVVVQRQVDSAVDESASARRTEAVGYLRPRSQRHAEPPSVQRARRGRFVRGCRHSALVPKWIAARAARHRCRRRRNGSRHPRGGCRSGLRSGGARILLRKSGNRDRRRNQRRRHQQHQPRRTRRGHRNASNEPSKIRHTLEPSTRSDERSSANRRGRA